MPFDLAFWKQWEGHSVDAVYLLKRCVGDAVFETEFEGRPAMIRMVAGSAEAIGLRVTNWEAAMRLSHPALVAVFASGKGTLGETQCGYAVMEWTEENLGEVLAERKLAADEAREMIGPVLGALRYLHGQGFAHGDLRAANVMALGDQVKISIDSVVKGGDAGADRRAVGALLQASVEPGKNGKLPEPYAGIVRSCLGAAGIEEMEALLRGESVPATGKGKWLTGLGVAAAVVGAVLFWPSGREPEVGKSPPPGPPMEAVPAAKAPERKVPAAGKAERSPAPKVTALGPPEGGARVVRELRPATVAGITQVMPEIPAAARNTINGRVRINVRVQVDGAGNVSQATLEPPAASKYFTDRVVAAARGWKFPAGEGPRVWVLQFELSRGQTRVSPMRAGN